MKVSGVGFQVSAELTAKTTSDLIIIKKSCSRINAWWKWLLATITNVVPFRLSKSRLKTAPTNIYYDLLSLTKFRRLKH